LRDHGAGRWLYAGGRGCGLVRVWMCGCGCASVGVRSCSHACAQAIEPMEKAGKLSWRRQGSGSPAARRKQGAFFFGPIASHVRGCVSGRGIAMEGKRVRGTSSDGGRWRDCWLGCGRANLAMHTESQHSFCTTYFWPPTAASSPPPPALIPADTSIDTLSSHTQEDVRAPTARALELQPASFAGPFLFATTPLERKTTIHRQQELLLRATGRRNGQAAYQRPVSPCAAQQTGRVVLVGVVGHKHEAAIITTRVTTASASARRTGRHDRRRPAVRQHLAHVARGRTLHHAGAQIARVARERRKVCGGKHLALEGEAPADSILEQLLHGAHPGESAPAQTKRRARPNRGSGHG
jgi:hypothetical protein